MKRKTIAEHAADVLRETNNQAVMFGDAGLLGMIADRAGITTPKGRYPIANHPLDRWKRVLDALERSTLFEKRVVHLKPGVRGNQAGRFFKLKEIPLAEPC